MTQKLLLLLLITPFLLIAQTPCTGGFAGVYPCNDYDLMDQYDKTTLSTREGSDIWGWTDGLDNKEYALMTFEDKTCFFDMADPVNPIYLGFINTNAGVNYWRDVKVYNNHAYIVADNVGAHGMQIFDLTRLRSVAAPPENFAPDAVYTTGFGGTTIGSCHNIVINEAKEYAYLVGCRSANGGGPIIVDLTNPTSPTTVGQYTADGYTHDAQVVTYNGPDTDHAGKELLIGSNESKVVIVDVTNPASPTKISEVSYGNTDYTHQGWFDANQEYFYVGDEGDEIRFGNNTRTIIFDFTDLDNPSYHSQYVHPTTAAIDHNLYIDGNLMYQANYRAGLRIIDISNVNNIQEVGYFDTYELNDTIGYTGAWSVYPFFASGNIIISDTDEGFFVVRKSGTLSVGAEEIQESSFKVYPNPANNILTIAGAREKVESIQIYSLLGQKVIEEKDMLLLRKDIGVSNLKEGFYFVRINNKITQKVLIKRK